MLRTTRQVTPEGHHNAACVTRTSHTYRRQLLAVHVADDAVGHAQSVHVAHYGATPLLADVIGEDAARVAHELRCKPKRMSHNGIILHATSTSNKYLLS